MLMGLYSSASTAPLFSIAVSIGVIAFYRFRRFWPALLAVIFACLAFIEVYSNRHFYHVMTKLALNEETAYYRIGLFDETFGGGMIGHWLTGYGYVGMGPGNDNSNFNFEHKDLVNIYIDYMVRHGLVALIPFLLLNFLYYRLLIQASLRTRDPADHWMVWCFASVLIGWNVGMMTVSALSQIEIFMHMLLAVIVNLVPMMEAASRVGAPALAPQSAPHVGLARPRPAWRSRFQTRVERGGGRRHA
jgi:hypothetical protein